MHVIIHLSIECTTPRMNPKVNCGLWVIMMYQYRFKSINGNKCTTLVRDVDNEGCNAVVKQGSAGYLTLTGAQTPSERLTRVFSVPFSYFCHELETALKVVIKLSYIPR